MQHLYMDAYQLSANTSQLRMAVPPDQEQLLIIKSGRLAISLKDTLFEIGPASIVLLMPGESYSISNPGNENTAYYQLGYRARTAADHQRGTLGGGSMVRDESKLPFRPHDRGGVKNYFQRPTAMSKRFEMHVTTLKEGIKSHEPHTHRAEEIVLVISNETEMQIADKFYKGKVGDIYYLGSQVSHAIQNVGKGNCSYFAFQFE
jgi:(S)-ureidoglycine aminohydrolase